MRDGILSIAFCYGIASALSVGLLFLKLGGVPLSWWVVPTPLGALSAFYLTGVVVYMTLEYLAKR